MRYRWLDMRREEMQRNLRLSHTVVGSIRRTMDTLGFVDVWTPSMTKGTPEGARDFLVPVRLQPGRFFALAQSPQIFKQLCVIGGIDRYYQIATCWRDEDLRADRQFEFRQLDLEMAFVEREDVLDVLEQSVVGAFDAVGREPPARPFPRMTFADAMARYGSDKPDLRFGLEIQDATEVTRGSEFGVFANAPVVRFLIAPRAFSRAELARLEEVAKEWGAKGLAYLVNEDGEVRSPIAKFLSETELEAFRSEPGTTVLFVADDQASVERVLGGLRIHLGRELQLATPGEEHFSWVIDFPLFQRDEDTGRWTFMHHPFTAPIAGHEELVEGDPGARAQPALRPDLERLGARLGLHPDPRSERSARHLQHDGPESGGGGRQVRLPARRARDGRAAARRVRDGDRPLRRTDGERAEHPRDHSPFRRSRAASIRSPAHRPRCRTSVLRELGLRLVEEPER